MTQQIPMHFIYWAVIWSPLSDEASISEAWQNLNLPATFNDLAVEFNQCFVLDYPTPKIPLIFSSFLNKEANGCREEWMRIACHLSMEPHQGVLPPDHLALSCEILAHALQRNEAILIEGMLARYLVPWVNNAVAQCENEKLEKLLVLFSQDIVSLTESNQ